MFDVLDQAAAHLAESEHLSDADRALLDSMTPGERRHFQALSWLMLLANQETADDQLEMMETLIELVS